MFLIRLLYERKRKNMKKRNTLIIAILVAGMLVACGNQQKDSTGSADSNITQDVKNEKTETETSETKTPETEIINPLAAIIDDYKNVRNNYKFLRLKEFKESDYEAIGKSFSKSAKNNGISPILIFCKK